MSFSLSILLALSLSVQIPSGEVVADVKCQADPTQSYALYLPRGYTAARAYPVIFAFDPGARGRVPVERYQQAAEQYGFIVAGSNNSRNGSPVTHQAVNAMTNDVTTRFHVDPNRIYVAGMSGGARVALSVALANSAQIAGAIASSAGFPDAEPRKTLPFPIFGTAGTEDFNHLEMRRLDAALTTPHRVVFFTGGHTWLSSDLAVEAVEWMEVQAMKSGRAPRDQARIDAFFDKRMAAVGAEASDPATFLALQSIVADFSGLKDVAALANRVAALGREKTIRDALSDARDVDNREIRILREMTVSASKLDSTDERLDALSDLRSRWRQLSDAARKPADSSERRMSRRIIALLNQSSTTRDPAYRKIIEEYRDWR
jgi:predicted esterase